MALGDLEHDAAQASEIVAGLFHAAADLGSHLDLRAQQLGADLPLAELLALPEHRCGWIAREVPALPVDEQVLLFNPDRERGLAHGHDAARKRDE